MSCMIDLPMLDIEVADRASISLYTDWSILINTILVKRTYNPKFYTNTEINAGIYEHRIANPRAMNKKCFSFVHNIVFEFYQHVYLSRLV